MASDKVPIHDFINRFNIKISERELGFIMQT